MKWSFTYKPECVSSPVLEVEVAKLILDQDVAGAEVHVTLLKDIAENLLFSGLGVFVPIEILDWVCTSMKETGKFFERIKVLATELCKENCGLCRLKMLPHSRGIE